MVAVSNYSPRGPVPEGGRDADETPADSARRATDERDGVRAEYREAGVGVKTFFPKCGADIPVCR